ncbi:MAG: DUF4037 domain-containing protein [Pseudomonadota bacterium]
MKQYIKKENLIEKMLADLEKALPNFHSIKGLVGITLNGGLARGYGDHLSEIDLTLFLDAKTYEHWNAGYAECCTGICIYEGNLYDIKYLNYSAEYDRPLSPILELWDLSYAKVLYDPFGKIRSYLDKQLATPFDNQVITRIMFETWWYYRLAGNIWVHREDPLQGHLILNEAIKGLLKAVFLANQKYVPHDKWLIHYCRDLPWLPTHWNERRKALLATGDLSIVSLKERQKLIDFIWFEINDYAREHLFTGVPNDITTKAFYDLILTMFKKKKISIKEWESYLPLSLLNQDPFYEIVHREKDFIFLKEMSLDFYKDLSMYAWHKKALQEVIAVMQETR